MAIYSSNYLRNLSQRKSQIQESKIYSQRSITHTSFDIFLSHSFLDREEVEGLYIELTSFGFSVYVDWIVDPQLDRNNVTKASATHIRNRMKSSKSLLLGVSVNASTSKWMPWELGFMDGFTQKCAIIPVADTQTPPSSFRGVEYLSLYPFIKRQQNNLNVDKLWVIEEARRYVVFDD